MRRTLRELFEYADEYHVAQSLLAAALVAGGAALIYKAMKPGKPRGMIQRIQMAASKSLPRARKPVERVRPSELKYEIRKALVSIARDLQ